MLLRVGYNLVSNFPLKTPAVLMLNIHPSWASHVKKPDHIIIDQKIDLQEYIDYFGNRCARLIAPIGPLSIQSDAVVEDSGLPHTINDDAHQQAPAELPSSVLHYLLASRYCEVDLFGDIAWSLFGAIKDPKEKVLAVSDFVHHHIRFDYQQARKTRTALETYKEKVGVCRDFTHLATAIYRALHIPTRYVTGYLGDINIEPLPFPMDFSSWAEVFLGGRWYVVDPRHNIPRIGYIPIAYGRDAADVAIMTSFGQNVLEKFEIWTYEVSE